jgi:hypothetical protein
MLLEAETNKYCPVGYDIGAISNLITWVLNFFLSVPPENVNNRVRIVQSICAPPCRSAAQHMSDNKQTIWLQLPGIAGIPESPQCYTTAIACGPKHKSNCNFCNIFCVSCTFFNFWSSKPWIQIRNETNVHTQH